MTIPNYADPTGAYNAAIQRRLALQQQQTAQPNDQAVANSEQMAGQADNQRQYMENSRLFNSTSNTNRRKSQNLKTANTNAAVIY